ncbi:MAG: dihydrofolate reductase family protein [Coriobacteriales bacterium]
MRVEIVANISINGQMLKAEQGDVVQGPQEITGMAFAKAMQSGNAVMGRATYEMFAPAVAKSGAAVECVVLTSHEIEGVKTARSPQEAIEYLEGKGFDTVTVDGGISTLNAFMEAGLVDDIFFNVFPSVVSGGGVIQSAEGKIENYKLAESKVTEGIVSLHYTR